MRYLHPFLKKNRHISFPSATQDAKKEKNRGRVAPAPADMKKREAKEVVKPVYEKRPKNFGIRGEMQPKKGLTRFVKGPITLAAAAKGYCL